MKILLIGATGMIGSRVAAEARNRGHQVTAASRSGGDGIGRVDARDAAAVAAVAVGHDAVVLATSPPRDGSEPREPLLAAGRGVLRGLADAGVRRLIVVGGAGSLLTAAGTRLIDSPDLPAEHLGEALANAAMLDLVRTQATGLDWTYISPPLVIQPGQRTGTYRRGHDRLLTDAAGNSAVSTEDYAVALVDELEQPRAIGRRITVAY